MDISKIYNANVYVDGTNNLLGKASELTLPDIVANVEEHKALGMIGSIELPTGLALMTMTMKWAGFYPEVLARGANPFVSHTLQVRANVQTFDASGLVDEQAFKAVVRGRWKKTPGGSFAAQTSTEFEDELTVSYIKVTLGDRELVEIDVAENVWRVDGEDLLANFRRNLGA